MIDDIRQSFLNFFKTNNHKHVLSSSLVPFSEDKSLMFTNSGMVQFKDYFLHSELEMSNCVSVQKCMRAGGKHNDLENIGYTTRHHTFFEMLGNFSFGKYFKEQAILYAYEFITKELRLPKEKLLITVYYSDDESFNLWKKIGGFEDSRILRISTEDNFWQMGNTGPCGPCTEIFFDLDGLKKSKIQNDEKFIEIWNLVFMEYSKLENGTLEPLKRKCVDTGSGLERLTAICEGKVDNFDIELFSFILNDLNNKCSINFENEKFIFSVRIILDHVRAILFLISDGVFPDRVGRGYVLRKIMRRAIHHCSLISEGDNKIIVKIFRILIEDFCIKMGQVYPEIINSKNLALDFLISETKSFDGLLKNGVNFLNEHLKKNVKEISGELAFKLYDTYGFPIDLTRDFAKKEKMLFDEVEFEKKMEEQKERSKKSSKKIDYNFTDKIFEFEAKNKNHSIPLYYEKSDDVSIFSNNKCYCNILKIFDEEFNEIKENFSKDLFYYIILNQTVCYPEGGGQVGDLGILFNDDVEFKILNTIKLSKTILHYGKFDKISIFLNNSKFTIISLRKNAPLNHTATHLLNAALRNIIGNYVLQRGSKVDEEELRFDFAHNKKLELDEIKKIENLVNYWIEMQYFVLREEIKKEDAISKGAIALFDEKYGDLVRVIEIKKEGFIASVELCGGTHVENTKEIKAFKILSESSVSSGVRRIIAITGEKALIFKNEIEKIVIEKNEILSQQRKLINDYNDLRFNFAIKEIKIINNNEFELNLKDYSADLLRKICIHFQNNYNGILKLFNINGKIINVYFVGSNGQDSFNAKYALEKYLMSKKNASGGGNIGLAQGKYINE